MALDNLKIIGRFENGFGATGKVFVEGQKKPVAIVDLLMGNVPGEEAPEPETETQVDDPLV